ncbi:GTP-binding protein [Alteromonas sp. KUL156]|uniref:Rab family GTPase n=1 Tax=Alteromonas sp. KUL106 TaxID=2480799 RepID=UPI0012E406B3|nr:Rab family GTPase [Alteromonas sp. KUL106]GFD69796.1 GTP-binding protein [Alteromonas sp. KUL106]GFD80751.1 GTP-binding protein [Tenacibaculum sp. KUL118]GFD96005.1 GTP-binding protein [Alteromonas sp. KUL154]GFD98556.1 GTP-binding protein [Alteromonas sp. KUL156]
MIQKKVCILGPTGVGKTSLIKQFVEGIFSEKYKTTIGVKIDKKQVNREGRGIQLLIWDLEGIDRYCGFNPRYLRGASAYIVVVDQTRSQSLTEGMEILELAKEHYPDIPAFFVINKTDLPTSWHWSEEELDTCSQKFALLTKTSAKTGENVESLFNTIAFW